MVFETIRLNGLIPVLKFKDAADALPTCKAVRDGGLQVAEITFRTAAAEDAIRSVCTALPGMLVGAGTVTRVEQAERAVAAGAKFIVCPGFNPGVVRWCVERGIPVLPGVNDPSGIEAAMEFGLQCVKFFPAEATGGVKFIKAVRGPYPDMAFVPTGGINEENLCTYLGTPGVTACGGSWMVPGEAIDERDYATITKLVDRAVQRMLGFRLAHVGLNTQNAENALHMAQRFSRLFGFALKEGNSSVMAAPAVELMKGPGPGDHGHIAIGTQDVDRAVYFLEQAGVTFDAETAKYDDKGKRKAIYMKEMLAGFAVHLLQC